jgi:hypothetical protein
MLKLSETQWRCLGAAIVILQIVGLTMLVWVVLKG